MLLKKKRIFNIPGRYFNPVNKKTTPSSIMNTSPGSGNRFIQPGAFSQAYNTTEPSREMQGGRRQTGIFQDNSIPIVEVQKLLNHARLANSGSKKSSKKQQEYSAKMAAPRQTNSSILRKQISSQHTPPKHSFGSGKTRSSKTLEDDDSQKLVLPDPPNLGSTLSNRLATAAASPSAPPALAAPPPSAPALTATTATAVRMSSNGVVLRRGSQVGTAPRAHVRQYRHPREMEAALIDSEAKIALLEDKLEATTSVLRRTQQELLHRNADLEMAGLKTNSLMLMVQDLLQHVVEKREGRRFSETESMEIENVLKATVDHFKNNDSMKDYIDSKINAIDDLLPKWTSLPSNFMSDTMEEDSNFGDDCPPPLPAGVNLSRRR